MDIEQAPCSIAAFKRAPCGPRTAAIANPVRCPDHCDSQSGNEALLNSQGRGERVTCARRGSRLRQAAKLRTRIVLMPQELAPPPAPYLDLIISAPLPRCIRAMRGSRKKNPSIRVSEGSRTAIDYAPRPLRDAHRAFWLGSHGIYPRIRSANSAPGRFIAHSPSSHQTLNT